LIPLQILFYNQQYDALLSFTAVNDAITDILTTKKSSTNNQPSYKKTTYHTGPISDTVSTMILLDASFHIIDYWYAHNDHNNNGNTGIINVTYSVANEATTAVTMTTTSCDTTGASNDVTYIDVANKTSLANDHVTLSSAFCWYKMFFQSTASLCFYFSNSLNSIELFLF